AFKDGILAGANLINCTHHAGRLRRAILRKCCCDEIADRKPGAFTQAGAEVLLNHCMAENWLFPRAG
ncbi:MAG: hypothetical protein WCK00_11835, partial [Deltaproteobacteria bacterium]